MWILTEGRWVRGRWVRGVSERARRSILLFGLDGLLRLDGLLGLDGRFGGLRFRGRLGGLGGRLLAALDSAPLALAEDHVDVARALADREGAPHGTRLVAEAPLEERTAVDLEVADVQAVDVDASLL